MVFMIQDKGTCTNTDHVSTSAAAGSQVVLFSDLEETPGPSHQGAEAADHSEDSITTGVSLRGCYCKYIVHNKRVCIIYNACLL